MDNDANDPQPVRPDFAGLIQSLLDLRNALHVAVLALSDHQCRQDSQVSRAAQLQMLQVIERAKARDYSPGEGH